MICIGIVTHNDVINKDLGYVDDTPPDPFLLLIDLITCIDKFTEQNYILIIRDNESLDYRFKKLDVMLKSKFKHINYIFIRSEVNSLTDAWNEITKLALREYNCEAVILLNQDILVTKYWNNFTKVVAEQNKDILAPMSNGAAYQKFQRVKDEDFIPKDMILHVPSVQGFCFGASRCCFESNMYDIGLYFDPKVEWGFNEEEWQQRNNNSGGRSLILQNSFVIHLDQGLWLKYGLQSSKKFTVYTDEYRLQVLNSFKYSEYYN